MHQVAPDQPEEQCDRREQEVKERGDDPEYIKSRTEYTKKYYEDKSIYDYKVINKENKLDEAVDEVIEILKKEGFIDKIR